MWATKVSADKMWADKSDGNKTFLEIKLSAHANLEDKEILQEALAELNKFLDMKMTITESSSGEGGGGLDILEGSPCPNFPWKGDHK